jgi:hypothetical protein
MLRTFSVQKYVSTDEEDPWSGILTATAFTVMYEVHAAMQSTPMQPVVFGQDVMFDIQHCSKLETHP